MALRRNSYINDFSKQLFMKIVGSAVTFSLQAWQCRIRSHSAVAKYIGMIKQLVVVTVGSKFNTEHLSVNHVKKAEIILNELYNNDIRIILQHFKLLFDSSFFSQ